MAGSGRHGRPKAHGAVLEPVHSAAGAYMSALPSETDANLVLRPTDDAEQHLDCLWRVSCASRCCPFVVAGLYGGLCYPPLPAISGMVWNEGHDVLTSRVVVEGIGRL